MTQQDSRNRARWNRLSLAIMGAGVTALLAAVVLFVLSLNGSFEGQSGPGTITGVIGDIREVLTPEAEPTDASIPTVPTVPPSEASIARIRIPRFDVDAPVVVRGVDASGVMETPSGPSDVAWYDFSARPGFGSNAVFSGHVDYINYGAAVFWNVKNLELDDLIEVSLGDETVYSYRVISKDQVNAATADVGEIVGGTQREIITLITCGGRFDPVAAQYDDRVIVRAERFVAEAPSGLPAGASSP